MEPFDYSKVIDELDRDFGDLSKPENRGRVAQRIAKLELELHQMKGFQSTLIAALRARDVVAREGPGQTLAPPPRLIQLTARDALRAEGGLHPVEWDGQIAYRWTGPGEETVLRVWLDRTIPVVFEAVIYSYGDQRNRNALELRIDGSAIAFREAGEKLLQSEAFPVVAGSLYTEVAVRTPWMSVEEAPERQEIARGRRARAAGGAKRSAQAGSGPRPAPAGARGFAFTHFRFLSPA